MQIYNTNSQLNTVIQCHSLLHNSILLQMCKWENHNFTIRKKNNQQNHLDQKMNKYTDALLIRIKRMLLHFSHICLQAYLKNMAKLLICYTTKPNETHRETSIFTDVSTQLISITGQTILKWMAGFPSKVVGHDLSISFFSIHQTIQRI